MAIEQTVDGRWGHLPACLLLVGLRDLGHAEHAARLGALDERRQQHLLLLGAQVLVAPTTAPAQLEDGIALLGPARVDDMHRGSGPSELLRDLRG